MRAADIGNTAPVGSLIRIHFTPPGLAGRQGLRVDLPSEHGEQFKSGSRTMARWVAASPWSPAPDGPTGNAGRRAGNAVRHDVSASAKECFENGRSAALGQ
jgi:hypothetical protein